MHITASFRCRYCPIDMALRTCDEFGDSELASLILSAPVLDVTKPRFVDVKPDVLKPGDETCRIFWHSDTMNDPDAVHHLWAAGMYRTIFKYPDREIDEATWKTYGKDLHIGRVAKTHAKRLLVRVTESDVLKGCRDIKRLDEKFELDY